VEKLDLDTSTASAVCSLIDAVDSESTVKEFDIGKFNKTRGFDDSCSGRLERDTSISRLISVSLSSSPL